MKIALHNKCEAILLAPPKAEGFFPPSQLSFLKSPLKLLYANGKQAKHVQINFVVSHTVNRLDAVHIIPSQIEIKAREMIIIGIHDGANHVGM